MVKNSTYFYLGGFISLTLFISFISLFLYMMLSSSKQKIYALKKDKYISISINISSRENKTDTKVIKEQKQTNNPVQKIQSKIEKNISKNFNVENLFDDVWTKKIVLKEKKVKKIDNKIINSKVLKEIEKKIKKLDVNAKKTISTQKDKIEKDENKIEKKAVSSADEVNEYLAKINSLVYKYFKPPQNSEGHSVKAVIELTALGKVTSFRILNYSANDSLNSECEKIGRRLLRIVFPLNPKKKSSRTIVILTSKE